MGMGGAFTAVANDANAAYWNPAGLAINPGVDISGSLLINNRNVNVGDNFAALKMCFETELNPFAWIVGIGALSLLAVSGSQYLSDTGVLKKNWGREGEKHEKTESMAEDVLSQGEEPVRDVHEMAKEQLKETGKAVLEKTTEVSKDFAKEVAKQMAKEAVRTEIVVWPLYRYDYGRPTYWDNRYRVQGEYSPFGKAQFAMGISYMTDKNSDPSVNLNSNWYTLSVASGYEERVALGANVNIYDLQIASSPNIKGFGAGIDVGAIFRPADNFALGLAAKEMLTTDIQWSNGAATRYEMNVNVGAALNPFDWATVAIDMHNIFNQNSKNSTMHYGIEVRPIKGVAMRVGVHDESKTAGMSLGLERLYLDYAYLGGSFGRTQMLGVTYKL